MDNTQLDDLKQFISATVSQATADMATKQDIANMATKSDIAELKDAITNLEIKVDTIADALTEDLQDHEQRLTKLEHKVA